MSWNRYNGALETQPLITKAITAAVGFTLGDLLAQSTNEGKHNWARTARMASFGLLIAGPIQGHFWFNFLDKRIHFGNPTGVRAVITKMACDQLFNAPIGTAAFFAYNKLLEGDGKEALPVIKEKLLPTVVTGWKLWVPAHIVNFALVPNSQRVLYTNVVAIAWTYILSCAAGKADEEEAAAEAAATA